MKYWREMTPLLRRDDTSYQISLMRITPALLSIPSKPLLPVAVAIKPLKQLSGWYAGLQATPGFNLEASRQTRPHAGPGKPMHRFTNKQQGVNFSMDYWLKIGKKINRRFGVESGIGYRAETRVAGHKPNFRFGDGMPHGGAPFDPHRREYTYTLDSYSGSATVNLRMEQTDNSIVDDHEPLQLEVTSTENQQLLHIPVLLTAQLGSKGRLSTVAKAGLTANIFLKNEIDISAWSSKNARFQPVHGGNDYSVQFDKPGKFFLGYWVSGGLEFRLNRRISLGTELVSLGDLARIDAGRQRLPAHFSLGLNVGGSCYF